MTEETVEENKGENELENLRKENQVLMDDIKRIQADFENYRKRADKEVSSSEDSGKKKVLEKLIALADEFDAAIEHMHKSSESELRNGIRLLHKKLLSVLKDEGVEPLECIGKKFDSDTCDAVEVVDGEGEDGIVLKELRKGYSHRGTVLRHAMVSVSKKKINVD